MFTIEALAEAIPGHEFTLATDGEREFICCDGERMKVQWHGPDSKFMKDVHAYHT